MPARGLGGRSHVLCRSRRCRSRAASTVAITFPGAPTAARRAPSPRPRPPLPAPLSHPPLSRPTTGRISPPLRGLAARPSIQELCGRFAPLVGVTRRPSVVAPLLWPLGATRPASTRRAGAARLRGAPAHTARATAPPARGSRRSGAAARRLIPDRRPAPEASVWFRAAEYKSTIKLKDQR
jgi:hypothetical protein